VVTTAATGGARVPGVARIVALLGPGIGDAVFALPALEALRAAYNDAELVVLATPPVTALLPGRTVVDRALVLPGGPACWAHLNRGGGKPETRRVLAALRTDGVDLAVQLYGGGRESNHVVLALGARVSVGTRTPDAPALDRTLRYVYSQTEVLRWLEVVSLVGAPPVALEPALRPTWPDVAAAREALRLVDEPGAPVALLHAGAGDPRRRWAPASFAAVADALAASGAAIACVGSVADRELAAEVAAVSTSPVADLTGRLDLAGLAALGQLAAVAVANDSGPLHVLRAAGARTVGVYWCGNLVNAGGATRARHRPVLSWRLSCPVCGVDCISGRCTHGASFVADAPLAEVRDAALELLADATAAPAAGR